MQRNVTYKQCVTGCAKTAELVEPPFEIVSGVSPRNRLLDGRAHWRHLANRVEKLRAASWSATRSGLATWPAPNFRTSQSP